MVISKDNLHDGLRNQTEKSLNANMPQRRSRFSCALSIETRQIIFSSWLQSKSSDIEGLAYSLYAHPKISRTLRTQLNVGQKSISSKHGFDSLTVIFDLKLFFSFFSCWSFVGKTGRKQRLSLARGCWNKGTVVHEIGEISLWNGKAYETSIDFAVQSWIIFVVGQTLYGITASAVQITGMIIHVFTVAYEANKKQSIIRK